MSLNSQFPFHVVICNLYHDYNVQCTYVYCIRQQMLCSKHKLQSVRQLSVELIVSKQVKSFWRENKDYLSLNKWKVSDAKQEGLHVFFLNLGKQQQQQQKHDHTYCWHPTCLLENLIVIFSESWHWMIRYTRLPCGMCNPIHNRVTLLFWRMLKLLDRKQRLGAASLPLYNVLDKHTLDMD